MELYQKRYDEGYDITDPRYLKWKEIYYTGVNCNEWEGPEKSLAEEFSYIEPCSPVALLDNPCTVGEEFKEPSENIIETNDALASTPEPVSEAPVSNVATLNASEEGNGLKHISKFLVQYVPAKEKVNPSQAAKCVCGAKILTSSECVAIIEGRERNKKMKEQEKDERKAKREEKRKEKEEIAKKKAEQKQTKQKAIQNNLKRTS